MIDGKNQLHDDIEFLNSLIKNNNLEELKEKTDLFIVKYPEHYVGFFFSAVYFYYNNNFDQAEIFLGKALEKNQYNASIHNLMGLTKKNSGKMNEAIDCYKKALDFDNKDISIYINLSSAFIAIQDYKKSIDIIKEAKKIDETNHFININEASSLLGLREFSKAKEITKKLYENDKSNPILLNSIGTIHSHEKKYELALEFFNKSYEINKNDFNAFLNITETLIKLDKNKEAIKRYQKNILEGAMHSSVYDKFTSLMLKLNKLDECYNFYLDIIVKNNMDAYAHNQIGNVLRLQNKNEEAIIAYQKAISFAKQPSFYNNLGAAYQELANFKESEINFNKALELSKSGERNSLPACYHNLGNLNSYLNNFDKANENYKRAIDEDPYFVDSFKGLVRNKGLKKGDRITKKFLKIFNDDLIGNGESRATLAFALGELYEYTKEFEQSSKFYSEANKIVRESFSYKTDEQKKHFDLLKAIYSKSNLDGLEFEGNQSKQPIFIIGLPRSGSTLVEQIISNHSCVFGAGEVDYIQKMTFETERILNKKYPFQISDFNNDIIEKLAAFYLNKFNFDSDITKVTDKNLSNFISVGLIRIVFPKAKIINVSRNKNDNCLSIFSIKFTGFYPYAYNIKEVSAYYDLYNDLMEHWNNVFPGLIYNVQYEDVVSNIEEETIKMLEYCNLPFEKNCIEFYKNKRPVMTASSHQVRKKLYNSSVDRWLNYKNHLDF